MLKARIAVLVSGGGTNLQALIDAEKSGIIKSGTITAVISSKPGVYALERAAAANIPGYVVNYSECAGQNDFEAKLISILNETGADS